MNKRSSFIISLFIAICFLSCDIKLVDEKSQEIVIEPVQITYDKGLKANPALSPDGTQLAYSRTNITIPLTAYSIETGTSYLFATIQDYINGNASISNDGLWIAYHSYTFKQIVVQSVETGIEYPIPSTIQTCSDLLFSPNGKYICYISSYNLWVVDLADSTHHLVAQDPEYYFVDVSWFADSKSLIFNAYPLHSKSRGLWAVSIETGEYTKYSNSEFYLFRNPSMSPDQTKIAFSSSYRDSIYSTLLWIYSVSEDSVYLFSDKNSVYNSTWSSDGSMLMYEQSSNRTYIYDFQDDSTIQLTIPYNGHDTWLERENLIIIERSEIINTKLSKIDLTTNKTRLLTVNSLGSQLNSKIYPAFDLSNDRIFYSYSGSTKLSTINLTTHEITEYKTGQYPEISRNGEWLVYDNNKDIFLCNLNTGATKKLIKTIDDQLYDPALSPNASKIACLANDDLVLFDIDGDTLIANARLNGNWSSPAWSPENPVYGTRIAANYNNDINLINPENLDNRTVLGNTKNPAWSPDGNKLYYVDRMDDQIYSRNIFYEITNE